MVCWSMEVIMEPLKLLFHQKKIFQSSKITGPRWYQFRCCTKNHSIPPLFFVDYLFWSPHEYKSPLNARKSRKIKNSGWTSLFISTEETKDFFYQFLVILSRLNTFQNIILETITDQISVTVDFLILIPVAFILSSILLKWQK